MANKVKKCVATVDAPGGARIIAFMSNVNLYTSGLSTATGIKEATTAAEKAEPVSPIHLLVKAGFLYRVTAKDAGTGTTPAKTTNLLCANKQFTTFQAWCATGTNTLPTGGGTIVSGGLRMNRMSVS